MIDDEVRKHVQDALDKRQQDNQYQVSPIPSHVHNGTDSQQVDASTLVGILPIATGGTGTSTLAIGYLKSTGTKVVSQAIPIPVSDGGTSQVTLTAHSVLLGEGTSGIGFATAATTGYVLTANGNSVDPSFQTLPGYQEFIFTSSGTFLCPKGVTSVLVDIVGGGGGGGAGDTTGSGNSTGGGGGGGGDGATNTSSNVTAFTSYTVTVGAAGTGSVAGGSAGTGGGTSSFNGISKTGGGLGGNGTNTNTGGTAGTAGGSNASAGATGDKGSTSPSNMGLAASSAPGFGGAGGGSGAGESAGNSPGQTGTGGTGGLSGTGGLGANGNQGLNATAATGFGNGGGGGGARNPAGASANGSNASPGLVIIKVPIGQMT